MEVLTEVLTAGLSLVLVFQNSLILGTILYIILDLDLFEGEQHLFC